MMGHPLFLEIAPFAWRDLDSSLIQSSLDHLSPQPKRYLSWLAVLQDHNCDRLRDKQCYSVCNNGPHLCSTAMLPNKNSNNNQLILFSVDLWFVVFTDTHFYAVSSLPWITDEVVNVMGHESCQSASLSL